MKRVKFYLCKHCGNIIIKIEDSGVKVVCCGEEMMELIPNKVDASFEKHVPVIDINNNVVLVKVGSEPHPMTVEHHISWIVLETDKGFEVKYLNNDDKPIGEFYTNNKVIAVYEYCNLHGLWVKE